jgi:hypothetical protein
MTRAELETAVYDEAGHDMSPPARVVTRIRRFLTEGVQAVLAEPGLGRLVDSDTPLTFTSVANQARYVLPMALSRILHITERTNDWRLTPMSLASYRLHEPDPAATAGTSSHYVPIGRVGVAVQPSDASEVFVDSTSASDVGTAYLEGIVTGGYQRTTAVTMTGTTAVSLSAAITSFIELNDFYLSHAAFGTVTLHEDASGGTELAQIAIGQTRPQYFGLYLWPTPQAAVTYYVDYRREDRTPLAANTSEPPWPVDYHPLLVAYATWREWMFRGDSDRAAEAKARYGVWLAKLKYATQVDADEILVVGRGRRIGHSRLGGSYPADTYTVG